MTSTFQLKGLSSLPYFCAPYQKQRTVIPMNIRKQLPSKYSEVSTKRYECLSLPKEGDTFRDISDFDGEMSTFEEDEPMFVWDEELITDFSIEDSLGLELDIGRKFTGSIDMNSERNLNEELEQYYEDFTDNDSKASAASEPDPCVGAVVYKRSSAKSEFVFETSLERLDLASLSTIEASKTAEVMRSDYGPPDSVTMGNGALSTAVFVSVQVEKSGNDLRLDGRAKTAMSVSCRRCFSPTVQKVSTGLKLLLTSSPVTEPSRKTVGVVLGKNKYELEHSNEEGSGALDLDLDDRVYFPSDEKEVDISKHVRDALHLDVPFGVVCRPKCKGLCVSCGSNLNLGPCSCSAKAPIDARWSKLAKLKLDGLQ